MFKQLLFMPLAAVFQGGTAPNAIAQADQVDRKVRIEIVTTENGETKRTTREFDASSEAEIQDALKDLGVMDHFNVKGDGENVTIDIRKRGRAFDDEDVSFSIAPMPPMPPGAPCCEPTAYLGVSTGPMDAEALAKNKVPGGKGVHVIEVISDTPAAKAGLKTGDVITELDGKAVAASNELTKAVRDHEPGDKVKLTYYRSGKKMTANVELSERSSNKFAYSYEFDNGDEEFTREHARSASPKAFLGVTPADESATNGAAIGSIEEGSSAEAMGIQVGDVITRINATAISDFASLSKTIKSMKPSDAVEVTVVRGGKEMKLSGKLGERSDHMEWFLGDDDTPGAPGVKRFRMEGFAPEDQQALHRDMDQLRREMHELRHDLGKDITRETRITIEALPLSKEEKDLLKSKGVKNLEPGLKLADLRAFPNPSNGFFRLQFDVADRGDLYVNVHDASGEKVYEERISGFKGKYERTLDLTDKATGTYFLVIQQGAASTAVKLVKE